MITLDNVTKKYGELTVLNRINYQFRNTGITCVLGASGSGKSTLLNLIAGFDSDYSGHITVCDERITTMTSGELCQYRKNHIGFVFQGYNLISGYTVTENILLAAELNGKPLEENKVSIVALLTKLGMETKAEEKVENLSGGQKQRVAIARALVNDPQILFADEPTGALDRELSNQIMDILQEIAKDRLVVVITHDRKLCAWSNEIISIVNEKLEVVSSEAESKALEIMQGATQAITNVTKAEACTTLQYHNDQNRSSIWKRAMQNYKVRLLRYIAVSVVIALAISLFIVSLSSSNRMGNSITEFTEKNTAFNNGYIAMKNQEQDPYLLLSEDSRIENVYYQYIMNDIFLTVNDKIVSFEEKIPMPKATETMSYGIMPRIGEKEIAITPSVGKQFAHNIHELIGQQLTVEHEGNSYQLTISGIYNAAYDDFFVSSDVEQAMNGVVRKENPLSISYDVTNFSDIVTVTEELADRNIATKTAVEQVASLEKTFDHLQKLFFIISIIILLIALFISIVLLSKQANSRYREIGVLAALGYNKRWISGIIAAENILLACTATTLSIVMYFIINYLYSMLLGGEMSVQLLQIVVTVISTFVIIIMLSSIVTRKLIATEPAEALRK
ncbi:ABC transporter ATP-binding protein/permease [Paenibacillus endoradicis]|uniref:ABC transporter ATP-binding protein/permease n=1 Tax=Paenibacillus endoradicis TaxID=2972487 RepID=UPI00215994ED|nr:ABC transporter ATP-binding protein/permease [Paenibacillus endoradicis]MCR8658674.1 ABC transporter ATP-binding protein/permease [Paenibacillus endoradicis]